MDEKARKALTSIKKIINLKRKMITSMQKMKLGILLQAEFPEEFKKSSFLIVNGDYYYKNFLHEFRHSHSEIPKLSAHHLKKNYDREKLKDITFIMPMTTRVFKEYRDLDLEFDKKIIKFK